MKKLAVMAFVAGLFGVIGLAQAADKDDPTGTWKWKTKFGKNEVEQSLKLELKDGKLTGTLTGGGKTATETKIEDGKFKDGELSFTVTRERKGEKIMSKYTGKVSDDTIKGSITTDFGGKENKADWEAKKVKEEKKKD